MSNPSLVDLQPFAVRPKIGAQLAGISLAEFYKRLNAGIYQTFLDGACRLVVVESILGHQQKQLAAAPGTPRENPVRRGGPGRPKRKKKSAGTGS